MPKQLASQLEGAPLAVRGGERFTVRFYGGPQGDGYIMNDLPRPGLAAKIRWHYIVLAGAI